MKWPLVIVLNLVVVISGCTMSACGNNVLRDAISPDGKHIATVFERNCGATTSYVRVVMVRDSASSFDGGSIDDFIFTMQGQYKVDVRWESIGELVIVRAMRSQDIFKNLDSWQGIRVSYSTQ